MHNLKDFIELLKIFRDFKSGITLDKIAEILDISVRTVHRRLKLLKEEGFNLHIKKVENKSFYFMKLSDNLEFGDILEYFPVNYIDDRQSIYINNYEFEKVFSIIYTIENTKTNEIVSFINAESAVDYFPSLKKYILFPTAKRDNLQNYKRFERGIYIITKSPLIKVDKKIKKSKINGRQNKNVETT